jgi:hypothetical protein
MHRSWRVPIQRCSAAAGILWLVGCSPKAERSGANAGSTSGPLTDAAAPLDDAAARSAEYRVGLGAVKRVTLADGKFYDSTSHLSVTLLQTLPGDLDGDQAEDAVVLLGSSAGASGTFSHLVPVLNRGGQAVPGAATLLGDRILLQAISLADRIVTVEMITQGPRDPMCCPTQPVRQRYRLERDSLVMLP